MMAMSEAPEAAEEDCWSRCRPAADVGRVLLRAMAWTAAGSAAGNMGGPRVSGRCRCRWSASCSCGSVCSVQQLGSLQMTGCVPAVPHR